MIFFFNLTYSISKKHTKKPSKQNKTRTPLDVIPFLVQLFYLVLSKLTNLTITHVKHLICVRQYEDTGDQEGMALVLMAPTVQSGRHANVLDSPHGAPIGQAQLLWKHIVIYQSTKTCHLLNTMCISRRMISIMYHKKDPFSPYAFQEYENS